MPGGGFSPSEDFNEAKPAGTDYGYLIDDWVISNTKHLCNAYAAEHYEMSNDPDASETDFGRHDYITLKQQSAKPTISGLTTRTALYTKSDGVYIEKADGTEIQILDFTTERSGVDNDVPSGEIILFEKDTAVTGYTLQTDKDDMAVYITKGSVAGGESGGTDKTGGTWPISGLTADSHTHTGPLHNHSAGSLVAELAIYSTQMLYDQKTASAYTGNYKLTFTGTASVDSNPGLTIGIDVQGPTDDDGDDATSTASANGITSAGTWRPPGRNFTRQQRN